MARKLNWIASMPSEGKPVQASLGGCADHERTAEERRRWPARRDDCGHCRRVKKLGARKQARLPDFSSSSSLNQLTMRWFVAAAIDRECRPQSIGLRVLSSVSFDLQTSPMRNRPAWIDSSFKEGGKKKNKPSSVCSFSSKGCFVWSGRPWDCCSGMLSNQGVGALV